MATETIVVEMTLDDGNFTRRIVNASGKVGSFKKALDSLDSSFKKIEKSTTGATASVRDWAVIIGQSRNVIHQLWFVTGQWMTSMVRTSAQVEKMTYLMKGMSDAGNEVAKAAEAAKNVEELFKLAKNAPFTVNALSDSFVKFKSVGMDPLDGSMQSLVDAVAAFGGTDETLHRASIAIQQMAGKGVISMEELRQQLGEAVPQAITIMAQSLGVSYGELVKQISEGKVLAEPALKAMFTGFEIAFGGRAQGLMDSFDGKLAQFKTSWTELVAQNEGIQNFFQSVKDGLSALTGFLDGRLATDFMTGLGNGLAFVGNGFTFAVERSNLLYSNMLALIEIAKTSAETDGTWLNWMVERLDEILGKMKQVNDWTWDMQGQRTMTSRVGEFIQGLFGAATGEGYGNTQLAMVREKLINGLVLTPEELELFEASYDHLVSKMNTVQQDLADAQIRLNTALEDNAVFTALNGEEIFSREQVEAIQSQRMDAEDALKKVQGELAEVERTLLQKRAEFTNENGWFAEMSYNRHTTELRARQEELTKQRNAVIQDLNLLRSINTERQRMTAKEAEVNGVFGDPGAADRLARLMESSSSQIANAAAEVQRLRDQWTAMLEESAKMGDGYEVAVAKAAETLAATWNKEIEAFQREQNTAGAAALAEAQTEMLDESLGSAEDRYAAASETMNAYFDQQQEGLKAIGAAAITALEASGAAGVEAAALVAAQIELILAQIEQRRANILTSMKGPTLISGAGKGGGGKSPGQRALEKLQEMIQEAQEKGDELQRRVVNPFAYELPKAIDSARKKLNKIAEDLSGGQWTAEMKRAFDMIATNTMTEEMLDMAEATRNIRRELMGTRRAREEGFKDEVRRLGEMKARLVEMGIWRVEWETIVQEQIAALRDQLESQTPWGQFANEWKNYFDDLESWGVDAVKSVSQALADMVTEGEANFADLARSALNSFLQIQINAAMSGIFDLVGGAIRKGIGSMGGAKVSHSGDIVGSQNRSRMVDAAMFMNAPRFHTGGVVGQEVPTILEKGEGVFTPAQMKAIGKGMSNTGEAKVNLINNTGMPMDAEETSVKFTPDGMVLDVVLKGMSRPGSFRDNMMRMMKK